MPKKTIVDVLDEHASRREKRRPKEKRAVVVATTPNTALIRVGGSLQVQHAAIPANADIDVGDTVLVIPNESEPRVRWVITSIIAKRSTAGTPAVERPYRELFPPDNIRTIDSVPGAITIVWDVPVQLPVAFQVQTSTDEGVTNSSIVLITRGSYAIIPTAESSLDYRIRSIAEDGQASGWSDWASASPAESTGSGFGENPVIYHGIPIWYAGSSIEYTPS